MKNVSGVVVTAALATGCSQLVVKQKAWITRSMNPPALAD
ncbi:hypothetical protein D082_09350 [Synechocystis sp. PCC 6714]|nr:hypothetical protein D082_09350 [Synechocystis sp. PCC 6714]